MRVDPACPRIRSNLFYAVRFNQESWNLKRVWTHSAKTMANNGGHGGGATASTGVSEAELFSEALRLGRAGADLGSDTPAHQRSRLAEAALNDTNYSAADIELIREARHVLKESARRDLRQASELLGESLPASISDSRRLCRSSSLDVTISRRPRLAAVS